MNPYIIGPYSESDTKIFWGRTKEIEGLYRSFLLHDYLVCYANSGEGKSSILNAGLFPKLRNNNYFPISIRFRFGEGEIASFDKIINTAIDLALLKFGNGLSFETSSLIYDTDDEKDRCWQEKLINNHVWLRLRYSKLKIKKENGEIINCIPVLIFDQFEEVFTNPESELWTKKFFCWLEKLSTDVCPNEILEELRKRVDEDSFSIISSSKRFKAIFSLRSEYVGSVDYWGLQHYYIPDLKNNRYFLKPLTPEGAKEVVMQPNGIDITLEECEELVRGCSENVDYVSENMPCVPASVLSIVCHELYEHTEQRRAIILKLLFDDKNATIENILENYYLKLLKKSGINDDKTRDSFENALVDDRGNRKRICTTHKDFSLLGPDQIKKLKDNNLLRVVSNASEECGEVVELPHDKFCGFIMNHKNKRFKEIKSRNNSLKEWLLFGVLGIILGATAWYFHYVFIDTLKPLLSDFFEFYRKGKETNNLWSFVCFLLRNVDRYEVLAVICIVLSTILTPCSILSFAKQWRKTAVWLSSCVFLISMWLIFRMKSIIDGDIGTFALLSLLLSLGIVLYITKKWKKITKSEVSSWPMWGSWFAFFCYLFGEFLRSLKIGVSEPLDSWYFIILLPMLSLIWTYTYFGIDFPAKRNPRGRYRIMVLLFIILGLLGALATNNMLGYSHEFKFSILVISIIFIVTFGFVIYFLWNIKSMYKRVVAIILNVAVIIAVYILNLGYNPFRIDYNKVYSVFSWRLVCVKDSKTNLLGICDPINGESIMPCLVSSYDLTAGKLKIKSLKFDINPISGDKLANGDSSFTWKDGVAEGFLTYAPTLEEHIRKIEVAHSEEDTLLSSLMDYHSTQLFKEIRSKCLEYLVSAKPYSLEDVKSLNILDSLQNSALEKELILWKIGAKDRRGRDKVDTIEDDDIHRLLSIITQNMYLYLLKDRILQKDFPSVFTLLGSANLLYYSSVPALNVNLNFNINYTKSGKVENTVRGSVNSDDITNNKCFAWYFLLIDLCSMDLAYNRSLIPDNIKYQADLYSEKRLNWIDKLENLNDEASSSVKELISNKDVLFGIKSYVELIKVRDAIINEMTSDAPNIATWYKTTNEDKAFNGFSKKVLETIFGILEQKRYNIYNDVFEEICMQFILIRQLRGYNIEMEHERWSKIERFHKEVYDSLMDNNSKVMELLKKYQEDYDAHLRTIIQLKK